METIRVNMTPCEDIKTIHASQNDNEAREWGFELHNNGDVIDSSEITDQMVFKAYEGGTEEILPTNGSVPTTSPFKGDIKYPQGLLSDQEFLYRESPTEEDGLANIVGIKGQTLKWNQHVKNGVNNNYGLTCATADGTMTVSGTSTVETEARRDFRASVTDGLISVGHKILLLGGSSDYRIRLQGCYTYETGSGLIFEASSGAEYQIVLSMNVAPNTTYNVIIHPQIFDLTQMFGAGNEPSTVEEFTSLFPLYYPYNSGSLIPFNGNGIKTVGKNLLKPSTVRWTGINYVDGYYEINITTTAADERRLFGDWGIQNAESLGLLSGTYTWSYVTFGTKKPTANVRVSVHGTENYVGWPANTPRYINADDKFFILLYFGSAGTYNGKVGIQFELGSTVTSYEPYTESVINLPISTYFPSGMKDVPDYTNGGKIYDEMTSNKADTRVGSVDLGTLNWTTYSSPERHVFRAYILSNMKQPNGANLPNAMCSRYEPMAYNPISANDDGYFAVGAQRIVIIEHDYTDPVAFKESLSNVYLYYELATPTETSFTTASLVTENAEIPLSNEDGILIGKCTEQLSENPGFIDAKIKLSDADGECYSNKIQLHVERSPQ